MIDQILRFVPLFNATVTVMLAGGVHMFILSRRWTIPRQDYLIRELRRDVDAARAVAEGVAREHAHEGVRQQHDVAEALLREIRSVGTQVQELLVLRDKVRDVDDRTLAIEQDVSALACSEQAWRERPGYCPLHKVDCPLAVKPGAEPRPKEPKE